MRPQLQYNRKNRAELRVKKSSYILSQVTKHANSLVIRAKNRFSIDNGAISNHAILKVIRQHWLNLASHLHMIHVLRKLMHRKTKEYDQNKRSRQFVLVEKSFHAL